MCESFFRSSQLSQTSVPLLSDSNIEGRVMDDELLTDFIQEARDHLGDIESQLLKIEVLGDEFDDELVNTVFRAIHSIKGAAGFLGLSTIKE